MKARGRRSSTPATSATCSPSNASGCASLARRTVTRPSRCAARSASSSSPTTSRNRSQWPTTSPRTRKRVAAVCRDLRAGGLDTHDDVQLSGACRAPVDLGGASHRPRGRAPSARHRPRAAGGARTMIRAMTDGLDVSRLSPSDAVAALRSYPRRFRSLLTSFDEDERPDDLVHRAGADGLSAVDHADHVARSLRSSVRPCGRCSCRTTRRCFRPLPTTRPASGRWLRSRRPRTPRSTSSTSNATRWPTRSSARRRRLDRSGTVAGSGEKMTALDDRP